MKRRTKGGLIFAGAVVVAIVALVLWAEAFRGRDFVDDFRARKGKLVTIDTAPVSDAANHRVFDVDLTDDRGLTVRCRVQLPAADRGPTAALVLLGGLRTGRKTIEYLADVDEVMLLAIDYPYEGKQSGLSAVEFVRALPEIRDALMNTIPAAMLAVDYLLTQPQVDSDRVLVVGGSLGALFSPGLAATDERLSALVLLFGAGDLHALLRANAGAEMPQWLVPAAAWAGSVIVAPFEPLKYIGQISPRPVFMLNGLNDPRMPRECTVAMHEAAGEPKTIRFIDAGHVHVRSEEFRELVRTELEAWLLEEGIVRP